MNIPTKQSEPISSLAMPVLFQLINDLIAIAERAQQLKYIIESNRDYRLLCVPRSGALTPREREVVQYIVKGCTNKEIAFQLGLSQQTIKRHVSSLRHKLGAKNRAEVAVVALRGGLVDLPVLPEQAKGRTVADRGAEPHLDKKMCPGPGPKPQNHENVTPNNHTQRHSLMCDDIEKARQNREIVKTGVGDSFYDKQLLLRHNWPLGDRPPKGLILGELPSSALPQFADKFRVATSTAAEQSMPG